MPDEAHVGEMLQLNIIDCEFLACGNRPDNKTFQRYNKTCQITSMMKLMLYNTVASTLYIIKLLYSSTISMVVDVLII